MVRQRSEELGEPRVLSLLEEPETVEDLRRARALEAAFEDEEARLVAHREISPGDAAAPERGRQRPRKGSAYGDPDAEPDEEDWKKRGSEPHRREGEPLRQEEEVSTCDSADDRSGDRLGGRLDPGAPLPRQGLVERVVGGLPERSQEEPLEESHGNDAPEELGGRDPPSSDVENEKRSPEERGGRRNEAPYEAEPEEEPARKERAESEAQERGDGREPGQEDRNLGGGRKRLPYLEVEDAVDEEARREDQRVRQEDEEEKPLAKKTEELVPAGGRRAPAVGPLREAVAGNSRRHGEPEERQEEASNRDPEELDGPDEPGQGGEGCAPRNGPYDLAGADEPEQALALPDRERPVGGRPEDDVREVELGAAPDKERKGGPGRARGAQEEEESGGDGREDEESPELHPQERDPAPDREVEEARQREDDRGGDVDVRDVVGRVALEEEGRADGEREEAREAEEDRLQEAQADGTALSLLDPEGPLEQGPHRPARRRREG